MAARWYVLHVYSGFEKKVAESILELAAQKGMADSFEQVLVPTEEVVEEIVERTGILYRLCAAVDGDLDVDYGVDGLFCGHREVNVLRGCCLLRPSRGGLHCRECQSQG